MRIEKLKHGKYDIDVEKFSAYAGVPADESKFYLNTAYQLFETAIMKSLAEHKFCCVSGKKENSFILPYGPVKSIDKVTAITPCGEEQRVAAGNYRLVKNKIFFPVSELNWSIEYTTKSIVLGHAEELVIYSIADKLINDDDVDPNYIRKLLRQHKIG